MWLATPKPNAPAIGAPMSTASNTGRPWALRKVASLVSIGHSFSVSTARSEGAWVTFGRRAACDPARGASELAAPCAVGERGLAFVRLELELVERARERRAQATADDDPVAARLADLLHGGQAGGRRGGLSPPAAAVHPGWSAAAAPCSAQSTPSSRPHATASARLFTPSLRKMLRTRPALFVRRQPG